MLAATSSPDITCPCDCSPDPVFPGLSPPILLTFASLRLLKPRELHAGLSLPFYILAY